MKTPNYQYIPIPVSDVLDDSKFIVPQFQRSVVWNKKRRIDFINNVRNGEPFGIILVRNNNGRYELIDGLQRVTTIRDYDKNPFDYLTENDVDEALVERIIRANIQANGFQVTDKYISDLLPEMKKEIYNCLCGRLKIFTAIKSLRKKFGLAESDEIDELIDSCYASFEKEKDISGLTLNAINYVGPAENIPNVFYNLNTGGVTLSKYETYAALWSNPLYKIDDDDIIEIVKTKYIQLQEDSDLDVDFNEDELKSNGITLFEYCYALSGIIRDKNRGFDVVFGANNKSTDPVGFEVLSLILGLRVNKAEELHELLNEASAEFLVKIKNMLVDSLLVIQSSLKNTIVGLNKSSLFSDSTYLIYHILISYIKENYKIDISNESINRNINSLPTKNFKKYLPIHYVHDCITEYWRKNRQVSDLQRDIDDESKCKKYWYNIPADQWDTALRDFMDSQSTVNKNIPQKNKIFIDFFMKLKLAESPQYNKYFQNIVDDEKSILDFEHIAPKKRIVSCIKDLTKAQQSVYPISAVGNLCYLSVKDNRSKRDKTIYEFNEGRPSFTTDSDYLDFIVYPNQSEIAFVTYDNVNFRNEYMKFIKDRQNKLEKQFLELVKQYNGI